MNICIVVSNFYPKISNMLIAGAISVLRKKRNYSYQIIKVPGTFEIPVVISNLSSDYDGFVVLGCVIKGETSHYNYLCSSVFHSLSKISINTNVPIGNGILTCNNKKQALIRANPRNKNKGGSAAKALISVLNIIHK